MKRQAPTSTPKRYVRPRYTTQPKKMNLVNPSSMRSIGEKKNVDVQSFANIVAAGTGAVQTLLNGIANGNTSTTRVGRRVMMKSLFVRFGAGLASTTAGNSPIRLVIVYDKQTNANAPAITDVFTENTIYSLNNLANNRRFTIIVDEEIESLGTGGPQGFYKTIYRKMNLPIEFNETAGTGVNAITTGSVYAFVWQNGNLITAAPTNFLQTRIRYVDV